MHPSYADRLAAMNDRYQNAPVAGDDSLPPDGDYQAVIDRFDFIDAKSGRLYLKTEMRVTGGQHEGWPIVTLHDLEDPDKLQYLKAHLKALQIVVEDYSMLDNALQGALDAIVEVQIYTTSAGKSYAKVTRRHNEALGARSDIPYDAPGTVPVSDAGGGNDVPF